MRTEPEFSWSKSRHDKFEECRRLYWYHYYGSWGGWLHDAPAEARELYILKNLSTRQQWAGVQVHDQLAFALGEVRAGREISVERLVNRALARMRLGFKESKAGEYRRSPKRALGLVEHELSLSISDEAWRQNWQNAELCIRNFHASHWLETARALGPSDWLPIDTVDSFELDGVRVYAAPDFAFSQAGRTILVDWKTGGARQSDRSQILGYTLFAAAKWGVPTQRVDARIVYLSAPEEHEVTVSEEALQGFRDLFTQSVGAMRALLRDPTKNLADVGAFPMTDERAKCARCQFQFKCGRAERPHSAETTP